MRNMLSSTFTTAVAMVILAWTAPAQAQAAIQFDLPAQPLADSLRAVGSQTNTNLLFDPPLVAGISAPALKAQLTADQALKALLTGTGIQFEFLNDKTIILAAAGAKKTNTTTNNKTLLPATGEDARSADEGTSSSSNGLGMSSSSSSGAGGATKDKWWRLARAESESPSTDSTESVEQPKKLQEIIVTAQKRQERLQDVPISISVLRGEELDRSTTEGITEALNRVPGVATTVNFQGGGTQVAVRGVTASSGLFSGSSPVAYYLDSVPFGLIKTAIAPDSNAYDLERVEVLRGPQGTLYGASAQNGVVRLLTHDADLDAFEFKARTSASSTDRGGENYRGDLAVNVPLIEGKLAARAVVGYQDLSGWIDRPDQDDSNDAEIRNTRLKINAQPTEKLSVGLSAWLSRADYGAPPQGDSNEQTIVTAVDESMVTDYDVYGLKLGYELPAFSLASMTSYLTYKNEADLDLLPFIGESLALFTGLDSKVFSQEVILNSTYKGSWRWSAGGIYRDGEDRLRQPLVPVDFTDQSESFALFGELTRLFMDGRFELTGGLRYFEDDVTQIENFPSTGVPTDPLLPPDSRTFTATSPRIVLTWHPRHNSTVYGSYSEGFRSGFNQNANVIRSAPEFAPLEADTLKNYELGAKGSLWSGRVGYDTALFYIDWQDVQQTVNVNVGGLPVTAPINGPSASGMGFEFAATAQPVAGLNLSVSFSWSDLTMDDIVRSFVSDGPPEGVVLFEPGDRLNLSAEYTAGASADYAFPLGGNGLTGRISASANYSSEQDLRDIVNGVQVIGRGDSILTAQTSFSVDASDRWTASLFVDNVTDEDGTPARQAIGAPFWEQRIRPRTVGLQLEFHFR